MLYALGVFVFGFIAIFSVLFIMAGAPQEARAMWGVCVALAVFILIITILIGNMMAKACVYFNGYTIQIENAFRKPRQLKWQDIRRIDGSFDSAVHLYLVDGTKALTVDISMVNYELFCKVLKKQCHQAVDSYYQSKMYEHPQKCILRYGTEYYIVAGLIFLFVMCNTKIHYSDE